jgi:hypothetical protein
MRAHAVDQIVPLLLLLTCIGAPVYPFWLLSHGLKEGRTFGQVREGTWLVDAASGAPLSKGRFVLRKALDLLVLHGPFGFAVWPIFVINTGGLSLLLLGWCGFVVAVEYGAVALGGRRLLDRVVRTRAVLAQ